ncbi:hypothetical protein RJT34_17245 [Clitoria ternatea]|uniref:Uncharacterized protein n=1 Tax=Clitoria ternatea TaxID=43366 RepID=A0AAN9J9X1_CLITE
MVVVSIRFLLSSFAPYRSPYSRRFRPSSISFPTTIAFSFIHSIWKTFYDFKGLIDRTYMDMYSIDFGHGRIIGVDEFLFISKWSFMCGLDVDSKSLSPIHDMIYVVY